MLPLVHLFLDVLVHVIDLPLQLLPPLLRGQVAEVLWSGALGEREQEAGGREKHQGEAENGKEKKME